MKKFISFIAGFNDMVKDMVKRHRLDFISILFALLFYPVACTAIGLYLWSYIGGLIGFLIGLMITFIASLGVYWEYFDDDGLWNRRII